MTSAGPTCLAVLRVTRDPDSFLATEILEAIRFT